MNKNNISLVYKYNKDIQINGSIFYAFEYLIKLIDELYNKNKTNEFWMSKKNDLPKLYIICPNSLKQTLKDNYFNLFVKRYPVTKAFGASFRVNNYYNNVARMKLNTIENNYYFEIKKLVTRAFKQIKFCSRLEYLKESKNIETLIYTSYNTFIDLKKSNIIEPNQTKFLFQNRAAFQLDPENIKLINETENLTLLYETEYQKLPVSNKQIQYNLKLGFKYFYPKKLFQETKYNSKSNMICGKPSANGVLLSNGFNTEFIKPTKFLEDRAKDGFFFDGIKNIIYYQNFLNFEENNRIIPEALFYGYKIKFFVEENISINNIKNIKNYTEKNIPTYDTSVTRFNNIKKNGFDEYDLDKENLLEFFGGTINGSN